MRFLLGLVALAIVPAQAAPAATTSRYTGWKQCQAVEHAPPGQDWVHFRCKGLGAIPVWYICMDAARCRYGFGRKANVSGMFGTGRRGESWPIEWRGRMRGNRFEPFAVITRATSADPDERGSRLYVFRLRPDGTSCIIGDTASNAEARRIADAAKTRFTCIAEPDLP